MSTALALALSGCKESGASNTGIGTEQLLDAANDQAEWLTHGRTYDEQRFAPQDQINRDTVGDLGLAWFADLDTSRGQEATPLVIDGKIYITTAWSKAVAFDARTGKKLWQFDPEVPGERAAYTCCDVVNRGLATWGDKLYLGTLDGRLIALDRETGKKVWEKVTVDQSKPYTITGAPRIIDGKVIIGNGGAEYGVRGYVSAYDAESGEQLWRFYTIPGGPEEEGKEPAHLAKARETWNGEWWKLGGGGTVWDSMAYDPELDLLYIGVGNGSPWNQAYRSPGGGDNLYLSSIVALKPDTGEYVWHYQTTPGESWDFTATQHIMLADLDIDGQQRKVLMQAPKNGFFYVIDRETGEFISARNFTKVNWATGIDPQTGRPVEVPEARYGTTGKPFISQPGAGGAHSWHPMAFSPSDKLVYIPEIEAGFPYFPEKDWKADPSRGFNVGVDMGAGSLPAIPEVRAGAAAGTRGALIAWDPVKQEERWRVQYPGPWNGGLLATGGGLVFQGTAAGFFKAYSTTDGKELWSFPAQTGIVAAPVTYTLDGEQYVAVLAGWGGIWALAPGGIINETSGAVPNISRLLVFRLGGSAALPDAPPLSRMPIDPPPFQGTETQITTGSYNYGRYCGQCHGDAAVGSTEVPDLRRSALIGNKDSWAMVVQKGALQNNGMPNFAELGAEKIEAIRQYVIKRANEDRPIDTQKGSQTKN
ncbi:MAG: PQQ-dependent dehydrogenase, methanol/ethanol family [Sphingomonadaceae bacterium]